MEGLQLIKDLLQKGDWMVMVDLNDAHLSIPITAAQWNLLRFKWHNQTYEFLCLSFKVQQCSMSVDFFQFILKPSNWSICKSIHNWDFSSWGDWAINIMSSRYAMILNPLCQVKARIGFRTFVNSLMPTQEIQFLGLMVKSVTMKLALSPEKVKALMKKCRQVLQHQSALVRELSRVIGQMTASIFVILPAPLHYWNLQRLKNEGLRHTQSYETVVPLDVAAKEELQWLCQHLQQWNGKPIVMTDPDMVIETDASLLGWGACCADIRTSRLWLDEERMMHINCLELLGGAFAVKAPGKASKNIHIRLRMDITTAISYINRMGGTHSHILAKMACSLWQWCLGRGIVLSAEHLPGSQNVIADRESRTFHSSAEWATTQEGVPKYFNPTRSVPSRPFCYPFEPPTSPVHELAARPIRHGYRRNSGSLDKPGSLCFSSLFPGRLRLSEQNLLCGGIALMPPLFCQLTHRCYT